jgi:hypothetical protein
MRRFADFHRLRVLLDQRSQRRHLKHYMLIVLMLSLHPIHSEVDITHPKGPEMTCSRFTEDQIIGILKEHEAGVSCVICATSTVSALQLSRSGRPSMAAWMSVSEAVEGARRRECPPETDLRRCYARQCRTEGSAWKKVVTPAAKRQAVAHQVASYEMSERLASRVIGLCRMTMRYQVIRQDDPALRERL